MCNGLVHWLGRYGVDHSYDGVPWIAAADLSGTGPAYAYVVAGVAACWAVAGDVATALVRCAEVPVVAEAVHLSYISG